MLEENSVAHNLFTELSRANPEFRLLVPAKNDTLEIIKLSIDSVCLFFEEQKLQQGDRVSIIAHKNTAYFEIYLAALKFGLVFNPLNPSYSEKELNYFIGDFNHGQVDGGVINIKSSDSNVILGSNIELIDNKASNSGGALYGFLKGSSSFLIGDKAEKASIVVAYNNAINGGAFYLSSSKGSTHSLSTISSS